MGENAKKDFENNTAEKDVEMYETPLIEVVEIVCQNTPDWTHGSGC